MDHETPDTPEIPRIDAVPDQQPFASPHPPAPPFAPPVPHYPPQQISGLQPFPATPWNTYGQPPSGYYGYGPVYGPPEGTNGMAIASLVLGILGFFGVSAILALIFGCIGLSATKRTGQRGRGLAISGLTLAGAWIALFATLIVVGIVTLPKAPVRDAVHDPAQRRGLRGADGHRLQQPRLRRAPERGGEGLRRRIG